MVRCSGITKYKSVVEQSGITKWYCIVERLVAASQTQDREAISLAEPATDKLMMILICQ